jgi:SARP family transcriptional regulator, regulator of embCAB operon
VAAVSTNGTGFENEVVNDVLRVVIADDDEAGRVLLRTLIELEPGFQLEAEAADGDETLAIVRRLRPDLLVLDLGMPIRDGLEVLQMLRRLRRPPLVIVYTAQAHADVDQTVRALGAADCIIKGVPPDELLARLHAVRQRQLAPADHPLAGEWSRAGSAAT